MHSSNVRPNAAFGAESSQTGNYFRESCSTVGHRAERRRAGRHRSEHLTDLHRVLRPADQRRPFVATAPVVAGLHPPRHRVTYIAAGPPMQPAGDIISRKYTTRLGAGALRLASRDVVYKNYLHRATDLR